jgi:hypothetical protein
MAFGCLVQTCDISIVKVALGTHQHGIKLIVRTIVGDYCLLMIIFRCIAFFKDEADVPGDLMYSSKRQH